jgi:hypothetical protein
MAQMNLGSLTAEVASILHMDPSSGGEDESTIKRALNWSGRYIWTSRPWPERKAEVILTTKAPYSTGTATFTENSAAVTGSGTTWSSFTGRKMARAFNAPFYRISANGGVTAITLARNYLEDTAAGATYLIYQDEFDTASVVEAISSAYLLLNSGTGPMLSVSEARLDLDATIQTTSGKPRAVALTTPTTAGTPRIRVTPVPDDVYAILVKYDKAWVDFNASTDTSPLDSNKESLLVEGALLFAQRPADNKMQTSYEQLEALIDIFWKKNQGMTPLTVQMEGFNRGGSRDVVYLNVTT